MNSEGKSGKRHEIWFRSCPLPIESTVPRSPFLTTRTVDSLKLMRLTTSSPGESHCSGWSAMTSVSRLLVLGSSGNLHRTRLSGCSVARPMTSPTSPLVTFLGTHRPSLQWLIWGLKLTLLITAIPSFIPPGRVFCCCAFAAPMVASAFISVTTSSSGTMPGLSPPGALGLCEDCDPLSCCWPSCSASFSVGERPGALLLPCLCLQCAVPSVDSI
mmetsp:Transcript_107875/g.315372  ORF Transcript_107875/g.315372 Transcript_107875/m.315372 type:complete len:215 (+) Transcript_107875:1264-1908(+)